LDKHQHNAGKGRPVSAVNVNNGIHKVSNQVNAPIKATFEEQRYEEQRDTSGEGRKEGN
jgi:hypothetical protein